MCKELKELSELSFNALRTKHPAVPEHALVKTKYSDKTANDLTKAIIDCITLGGGYATRVNTQGQYNEKLGKWTKSTTRLGTSDIISLVDSKFIAIEVKIGKDKLSEHQIKTRDEIINSGGFYIVATSFSEFIKWYDLIIKGGCHE